MDRNTNKALTLCEDGLISPCCMVLRGVVGCVRDPGDQERKCVCKVRVCIFICDELVLSGSQELEFGDQ